MPPGLELISSLIGHQNQNFIKCSRGSPTPEILFKH